MTLNIYTYTLRLKRATRVIDERISEWVALSLYAYVRVYMCVRT